MIIQDIKAFLCTFTFIFVLAKFQFTFFLLNSFLFVE